MVHSVHDRNYAAFFAAFLLALFLVACGLSGSSAGDASGGEVAPSVAAPAIAESSSLNGQEIRVAVNAQFRPFVYVGQDGEMTGFDIELMNALADAAGLVVTYTDLPFSEIIGRVARGEYDAAVSAITITEERSRIVDFTAPYFDTSQAVVSFLGTGQGLAVRVEDADIFSVDDLSAATRVGVKLETTGDDYASTQLDVDVIRYPEVDQLLAALQNEDVDAIIMDVSVLTHAISEEPGIRLTQTGLTDEQYAVAVNKDRPDLLQALNEGLEDLQRDGRYEQLFDRYFSAP
jgi:ABC-type amino acid transport substrate-binding protein